MKRRDFLSAWAVAAVMALPAAAEGVVDSVVSQLRAQGFDTITEERTLLGRIRIVAAREDGQREIIINPRTGEILRDLWTPVKGGPSTAKIIGESEGSDGSGKGGDDGGSGGDDGGGGGDDHGGDDGGSDDGGGDDDSGSGGGDDDGGDDDRGGDDGSDDS